MQTRAFRFGLACAAVTIAGLGAGALMPSAKSAPSDVAAQSTPAAAGMATPAEAAPSDVAAQQDGVEICHCPPGNPDDCRTLVISSHALAAHMAHGDTRGPCFGEPLFLDPADVELVRILTNEILDRVSEIDAILSTAAGTPPIGPVRTFTFSTEGYDAEGNPTTIDIEMDPIIVIGDQKGCYKDPPGICCECPCP